MSRFWLRLDNAALIFPAIRRPGWTNVFRQSVTLTEDIDPAVLQQAVNDLKGRFPSLYMRLRSGVFWYYLEEIKHPLVIQHDYAYPLTHMGNRELRRCCLRILYYRNRIAVEFFHSLTDGGGAIIFLRTLAARYITLKYGVRIPVGGDIPDCTKASRKTEIEDSFQKYAGDFALSRKEANSYRLQGTYELDGFRHLTTGVLPTAKLVEAAHRYGFTVTVFLAAVMAEAVIDMQNTRVPKKRQKSVKITVPVNLRNIFPSDTLRNFALTVNLGVDPRLGTYSLEDLCRTIAGQMASETMPQVMSARIAANVIPQKNPLLKAAPLFIKNLVMSGVYFSSGESKGSLNVSNIGRVDIPDEMKPFVERLEFIIGVQYTYPNNCSVVSCGDVTSINMIRNVSEPNLERRFFSRLVELGVPVSIESNTRGEN